MPNALLVLLLGSQIALPEAIVTDAGLQISNAGPSLSGTFPGKWTLWDWSPDGQKIAASRGGDLLELPSQTVVATGVTRAGYVGKRLYYVNPQGLSSNGQLLVPRVTAFAAKPDGTRLAFITGGTVYFADPEGGYPRPLNLRVSAQDISWSADGRWLALISNKKLILVHPNGSSRQDLGEVQPGPVRWSPGGPRLLVRKADAWGIYDLQKREWYSLPGDATPVPQWTGPGRILVRRGSLMKEESLSGDDSGFSQPGTSALLPPSGFVSGAFPDPFRKSVTPAGSELATYGTLVRSDTVDKTLTIAVDKIATSNGREQIFVVPPVKTFKFSGSETVLRAIPLESEVRLIGTGDSVRIIKTAAEAEVEAALEVAPTTRPEFEPNRPNVFRPRRSLEHDGVSRDKVVVPMIYPILGTRHRVADTFLAPRGGGSRRHHGQDLMAPKMTPLLAVFDGTVWFSDRGTSSLSLSGANGYSCDYLHINNDTPGTDDGKGERRFAFPMNLVPGQTVRAGQIIAYCGDSGNAETTGAHLHFELHDSVGGGVLNAIHSLRAAQRISTPTYPDPSPKLKPTAGSTRWDGVIADYNREKGSVALDLTGVAKPGGSAQAHLQPRRVYVTVNPNQTVRLAGEIDIPYGPEALRPGLRLSVLGVPSGTKLSAHTMEVSFPPSSR